MELRRLCLTPALVLAALVAGTPAFSVDVEKKWRVSFAAEGTSPVDEIESTASNGLALFDRQTITFLESFIDPRDDSAAFGNLDVNSGFGASAAVQYAVTKVFLLEASVGYQESDVGDIEVSVQFSDVDRPIEEVSFNFQTYRIPAGTMTRVPIRLSGVARFRPRAKFNPYFGAGLGYSVIGFDASAGLNKLSLDMDRSVGAQTRLSSAQEGSSLNLASPASDLSGAEVDFRDTFEWHAIAGAELSIKRNWALFLDLRWTDASRDVKVGFNGGDSLGVPVPQLAAFADSGLRNGIYGPVRITDGGLIDGGQPRQVPRDGADPQTNCVASPTQCRTKFFLGEQDNILDTGDYYVEGGSFGLDGYSFLFGVRYTFK